MAFSLYIYGFLCSFSSIAPSLLSFFSFFLLVIDLLSVTSFAFFFRISYKHTHSVYLAYFIQQNAFAIHPCSSIYRQFIPFYCQVVLHFMNTPHLFIYSPVDGNQGCF